MDKPVLTEIADLRWVRRYDFDLNEDVRESLARFVEDPTGFEARRLRNLVWDNIFMVPYGRR